MQALVNEPTVSYGQSTTSPSMGIAYSFRSGSSSILLSPQRRFSDRVAEMFQKLNRLERLSKNWDSYQAEVPAEVSLRNARSFLIENHALALPFYFLAPGVNGEVMIEFQEGDKSAELYFLPEGDSELLLFKNDEIEFEGNLKEDFLRLIEFFNS